MFYKWSAWFKSIEPIKLKFQRWILGVPNRAPLSILENRDEGSSKYSSEGWTFKTGFISHDDYNRIAKAFIKFDDELFYGVSFKLLIKTFRNLNIFEKNSEEEKKFFDKSNYRRGINKKCCGVSLKEFVNIILEYKPNEFNINDWVDKVLSEIENNFEKHKEWEERYIPLRMELIRLYSPLKNLKKEFISNLLIDNPFIKIQEIGKLITRQTMF